MPWCPKCKNEYQDGVPVCADCGCELVAELLEKEEVADGSFEDMEELSRFFRSNGVDSAQADCKEADLYRVTVDAKQAKHAKRILSVFWMERQKEQDEDRTSAPEASAEDPFWDEEGFDPEKKDQKDHAVQEAEEAFAGRNGRALKGVFQEASQKAENFRSGAYTLLAVGVIGLIFVFLLVTGILPLSMSVFSKIATCIVMGGLFIVFIIMGISSFRSYEKQAFEAVKESALKEELLRYCSDHLSAEDMDGALGISAGEDGGEAYFKRSAEIKRRISENFLNLNEDYLDHFVDEVYGQIYQDS